MKIQRLAKTVQKELLRSPKKTILLASISLVAIYFWLPLIWNWLSPSGSETTVAAGRSAPRVAVPPSNSNRTDNLSDTNGAERDANRYEWSDLLRWMKGDPQMSSAQLSDNVRNPFQAAPGQQVAAAPQQALPDEDEDESAPEVDDQPPLEHSPEQLGLRLSSTLVGGRRRAAIINGKVYHEDEQIVVSIGESGSASKSAGAIAHNPTGQQMEFVVTEIQRQQVLVNRNGRGFWLSLQRPKLAGSDEMMLNELPIGQK